MIEASKNEIRKIFSNEIETIDEREAKIRGYIIFERIIVLAGMNKAAGKTCRAHLVYAIRKTDGYWEQVASDCGPWAGTPQTGRN